LLKLIGAGSSNILSKKRLVSDGTLNLRQQKDDRFNEYWHIAKSEWESQEDPGGPKPLTADGYELARNIGLPAFRRPSQKQLIENPT
jgi:hypothetical protein